MRCQKIFKIKKLKIFKPNVITLEKYKIVFKTIDGENHEYNKLNYADPNAILCSIGEYFLIGEKFLKDDEDYIYPIENIQKIKFILVDKKENVIEKYVGGSIRYIWYPKKLIKIYSEETKLLS